MAILEQLEASPGEAQAYLDKWLSRATAPRVRKTRADQGSGEEFGSSYDARDARAAVYVGNNPLLTCMEDTKHGIGGDDGRVKLGRWLPAAEMLASFHERLLRVTHFLSRPLTRFAKHPLEAAMRTHERP